MITQGFLVIVTGYNLIDLDGINRVKYLSLHSMVMFQGWNTAESKRFVAKGLAWIHIIFTWICILTKNP